MQNLSCENEFFCAWESKKSYFRWIASHLASVWNRGLRQLCKTNTYLHVFHTSVHLVSLPSLHPYDMRQKAIFCFVLFVFHCWNGSPIIRQWHNSPFKRQSLKRPEVILIVAFFCHRGPRRFLNFYHFCANGLGWVSWSSFMTSCKRCTTETNCERLIECQTSN